MPSSIKNVEMTSRPGVYRVLGVLELELSGPCMWHTEDVNDAAATGAIFRAYENVEERDVAYVLVADASADVSEPDIESLTVPDVPEVDILLKKALTTSLAEMGMPIVKWMSSKLNEGSLNGATTKVLLTAYIANDNGIDRQFVVARLQRSGRKYVVMGCFDVDKADQLAKPIWAALGSVSIVRVTSA